MNQKLIAFRLSTEDGQTAQAFEAQLDSLGVDRSTLARRAFVCGLAQAANELSREKKQREARAKKMLADMRLTSTGLMLPLNKVTLENARSASNLPSHSVNEGLLSNSDVVLPVAATKGAAGIPFRGNAGIGDRKNRGIEAVCRDAGRIPKIVGVVSRQVCGRPGKLAVIVHINRNH